MFHGAASLHHHFDSAYFSSDYRFEKLKNPKPNKRKVGIMSERGSSGEPLLNLRMECMVSFFLLVGWFWKAQLSDQLKLYKDIKM